MYTIIYDILVAFSAAYITTFKLQVSLIFV